MRKINREKHIKAISLRVDGRMWPQHIAESVGVSLHTIRRWLKPFPLTREEMRIHYVEANKRKIPKARMPESERVKRQNEANRKWYRTHSKEAMQDVKNRKNENAAWLRSIKENSQCGRCPESHPACLEFHHRDPSTKKYDVALMPNRGFSREKIKVEVDKCEIICSNCHRKHHWIEKCA